MKKQLTSKLVLKKLAIAKISQNSMYNIKGGDCLPTEPGWDEHESDIFCNHSYIP